MGPQRMTSRKRKSCSGPQTSPASSNREAEPNEIHNENALFWIFVKGGSLPVIVSEWLAAYAGDQTRGLHVLIDMLFLVCGCKQTLPLDVFASRGKPEVIAFMTNNLLRLRDSDAQVYPLARLGASARKVAVTLDELLGEVVDQARHSLLFDGILLAGLVDYLTCLSTSQVRAFRHTATLAALKLETHLIDLKVKMMANRKSFARRLNQTKLKPSAASHAETCASNADELKENVNELSAFIKTLFDGCFVVRFRDTVCEIRVLTVREMGKWIVLLPEMSTACFKYLKQAMVDPAHQVRLAALESLQEAEQQDHMQEQLESFIFNVQSVLMDRVHDKDIPCALVAIDLLRAIMIRGRVTVSPEDRQAVCGFVYSQHRSIAHAAGSFLVALAVQRERADDLTSVASSVDNGDFPASQADNLLNWLVAYHNSNSQFVSDSEIPALVDAVIDHNPVFTDWKAMTALLLQEDMRSSAETVLVLVMAACVSRAVAGSQYIVKVPTVKESKSRKTSCAELTEHFIEVLPELLSKYAEPKVLIALVSIISHMDLELYHLAHKKEFQKRLLDTLYRVAMLTVSKPLLAAITAVLSEFHKLGDQHSVATVAQLTDDVVCKLSQACMELEHAGQHGFRLDEDTGYRLHSSLQMVVVLARAFDVFHEGVYRMMNSILLLMIDEKLVLPDETYGNAIVACYYGLLWSGTRKGMRITPTHERYFVTLLVIAESAPSSYILHQVFSTGCDFLVVFESNGSIHPKLPEFVNHLANFLVKYILTSKPYPGEVEVQADYRAKLVQYWKLILSRLASPKMAYPFFYNFQKLSDEYRDLIKEMLTHAWDRECYSMCACVLIEALKELYLRQQKASESVEEAKDHFVDLCRTASLCAEWVSKSKKPSEASAALAKCIGEEVASCVGDHLLPVLQVIAHFATNLTASDKKKIRTQLMKAHSKEKPKPVQFLLQALTPAGISKDKGAKTQKGRSTKQTSNPKSTGTSGTPNISKAGRLNRLDVKVTRHPAPRKKTQPSVSATEVEISDGSDSEEETPTVPPRRRGAPLASSTLAVSALRNKAESSVFATEPGISDDSDLEEESPVVTPRRKDAPQASDSALLNKAESSVSITETGVSENGDSEVYQTVNPSQQNEASFNKLPVSSTPIKSQTPIKNVQGGIKPSTLHEFKKVQGTLRNLPSVSGIASKIDTEMEVDEDDAWSESSDLGLTSASQKAQRDVSKGLFAMTLSAIRPQKLETKIRDDVESSNRSKRTEETQVSPSGVSTITIQVSSNDQAATVEHVGSSGQSSDCISATQPDQSDARLGSSTSKSLHGEPQEPVKKNIRSRASIFKQDDERSTSHTEPLISDLEGTDLTVEEREEMETDVSDNPDGTSAKSPDAVRQSLITISEASVFDKTNSSDEKLETIDDIKVEVVTSPNGTITSNWMARPNLSLINLKAEHDMKKKWSMPRFSSSPKRPTVSNPTCEGRNATSSVGSATESLAESFKSANDNLDLSSIMKTDSVEDDEEMSNIESNVSERTKPLGDDDDSSSLSANLSLSLKDVLKLNPSSRMQSSQRTTRAASHGIALSELSSDGQSSEASIAADSLKNAFRNVQAASRGQSSDASIADSLRNAFHNVQASSRGQSSDASSADDSLKNAFRNVQASSRGQSSDASSADDSLKNAFRNVQSSSRGQSSDASSAGDSLKNAFRNVQASSRGHASDASSAGDSLKNAFRNVQSSSRGQSSDASSAGDSLKNAFRNVQASSRGQSSDASIAADSVKNGLRNVQSSSLGQSSDASSAADTLKNAFRNAQHSRPFESSNMTHPVKSKRRTYSSSSRAHSFSNSLKNMFPNLPSSSPGQKLSLSSPVDSLSEGSSKDDELLEDSD